MLVLLSDVIFFAQVDQVDDRFGSQEEEGVDELDLRILVNNCCRK
jgi:hypothetical protein